VRGKEIDCCSAKFGSYTFWVEKSFVKLEKCGKESLILVGQVNHTYAAQTTPYINRRHSFPKLNFSRSRPGPILGMNVYQGEII
jgi:hypothetical protein